MNQNNHHNHKHPRPPYALLIMLPLLSIASGVAAQAYPAKPIRFIVNAAPGGGSDFVGRILGQKLSTAFGQSVIIDNRPGAGGNVGAEIAARATPDGYTLLLATSSHASNISLYRKLGYHPINDFAPISQLTSNAFLLTVQPSLPAKSVKEFIALAKARKGELTYGSAGAGQGAHLGMELFRSLAGFDAVHVPYGGIGPAVVALLAGQIHVALLTPPPTLPHVQSGKLRVLGVTTPKRMAQLPDTPTITEAGFPGFEVNNWQGLLAPAGTPASVITRLHEESAKSLRSADAAERLNAASTDPVVTAPNEFAAFLRAEIIKWEKVIKQSGARAD